jgi:gamma-glutamyltranspeptidase/glutathione hydrolase
MRVFAIYSRLAGALLLFGIVGSAGCAAPESFPRAPSPAAVTSATTEGTAGLPAAPEVSSGYRIGKKTTYAARHMAAAANPYAAEAGREMLRRGGAAIDAAVAMPRWAGAADPRREGLALAIERRFSNHGARRDNAIKSLT